MPSLAEKQLVLGITGGIAAYKSAEIIRGLMDQGAAVQVVMTEAAIDSGFTRDLYIALGEPLGGGDWAVRLSLKPYVDWIWVGAFLMGLGGFVSITDKRYRKRLERENAEAAVDGATA